MALFRCGGSDVSFTTARTVYSSSNHGAPTGSITISEGISSYKYVVMTSLQGITNGYANLADGIIVSVDSFKTTPISQSYGTQTVQTVSATYVDDNTIKFTASENRDVVFILLS